MPIVDIRAFGNRELEKKLGNVVDKAQKTIVKSALRKESNRVKKRIVANIARMDLIESGTLLAGYQSAKTKIARSGKNFIRLGVENPTREALGIAPDDPYYYPYAVEYGHVGAEEKPFIRPAIDEHKAQSYKSIGDDIGKGIEREALK
jgi:HK97 gp10 family phage protein